MNIPTWRGEIITYTEENERLKEQYDLISEATTIIINKQNVKELLIEKSTSDRELQEIFLRISNRDTNKVISDFVECLRKIGYRELKKYIIVELFKQFYRNCVYRRYMSKIYYMRKSKRLKSETEHIELLIAIYKKEQKEMKKPKGLLRFAKKSTNTPKK